jgi:lysophospholipase L1-like esterase
MPAPSLARRALTIWRSPQWATRLALALLLIGGIAAGVGRREILNLPAEPAERSVRRFSPGAAEPDVVPGGPWAHVPAVLPGPADQWAGSTPHALSVEVPAHAPRTLILDVQLERARPAVLTAVAAPAPGGPVHVEVLVNERVVASYDLPDAGDAPPAGRPRAPSHLRATIPAATLGPGDPARLTLRNDRGGDLVLRGIRLAEARPMFALGHYGRHGRFPAVSALLIGAGLVLVARGRWLAGPGAAGRLLGPGLAGLALASAVLAPAALRGVPRGAWLALIFGLLPWSRAGVRRRAGRAAGPRLRRALANGAVVAGALAVSLVAGEYALRAAFRHDPWAQHVLTPRPAGPPRRVLNSLGFFEREFPLEKPPGVYRIAVLGDSLSISAPRPHRFGDVIAARLNERPPRGVTYEAVSFGETGADTNREIEILQQAVWRTDPDFVLLEWYVNDLENGNHVERPQGYRLIPGEGGVGAWLRARTRGSVLRALLEREWETLQERLGLTETYPAYMNRLFGDPESPHWQAAADELRRFIAECRAHRTPVAIALFPHLSAGLPAGAYEFADLHAQVLELCREEGVPCVDLRATFAPERDYLTLWVNRFDAHPNARAHRLAAERILATLGPLWVAAGAPVAGGPAPGRAGVSRAGGRGSAASRSRRS